MPREIIRLGPGECPDIETGARYFAALAFPGLGEVEARQDAVAAWVGSYLHEANRVDESEAPFADERLNRFVDLSPRWCQAKLRTTRRRLRDRSELARAVRPWMRDWLDDQHQPVSGIKKFTQRQIALHLCRGDPERASNFQKRVWRPGRPVLHLAIAYDLLFCIVAGDQTDFPINLAAVRVFGDLVERAQPVERVICNDPRFGVSEEELLRLEWVS